MKPYALFLMAASSGGLLVANAFAQNPLIMDQFTADPSARVFDGRMYVYPSHDIIATEGQGRPGWFCMADYHVFSSENLMDWTDHGVIVSQTGVDWVNPTSYSMWAPDCVHKDGKYYFYFPSRGEERGFSIGVAVSDSPSGPFEPEPEPIRGVRGIDPCVLVEADGSAYIYYSLRKIFVAKLKSNMLELESEPEGIANLPTRGLLEGPFVFERSGVYYLTYPHVENRTERIEYATGDSPTGPFTPQGVIMDESPTGCWTNQPSIVAYNGQWYLFYHDKDLSPDFDKARSIRADKLSFHDDGTIKKVTPTLRGVGVAEATRHLQIDRYSETSDRGVAVAFLDDDNPHEGWKTSLSEIGAWVRFGDVDFGDLGLQNVIVRGLSAAGGTIDVRLDEPDGPVLASVAIGEAEQWQLANSPLDISPAGVHDVVVTHKAGSEIEIDWIRFQ